MKHDRIRHKKDSLTFQRNPHFPFSGDEADQKKKHMYFSHWVGRVTLLQLNQAKKNDKKCGNP